MRLTTQSLKSNFLYNLITIVPNLQIPNSPITQTGAGLACGCGICLRVSAFTIFASGTVIATGAVLAIIAHNVKLAGVLAQWNVWYGIVERGRVWLFTSIHTYGDTPTLLALLMIGFVGLGMGLFPGALAVILTASWQNSR